MKTTKQEKIEKEIKELSERLEYLETELQEVSKHTFDETGVYYVKYLGTEITIKNHIIFYDKHKEKYFELFSDGTFGFYDFDDMGEFKILDKCVNHNDTNQFLLKYLVMDREHKK